MDIFTVYDSKSGAYMRPFYARSKGEAIRSFTTEVNSGSDTSLVAQYPADFTLFHLGSFDDEKASFDLLPTPVSLGVALEFAAASGE